MKSNRLKLLFVCALALLGGAVPVSFGDWDVGQPYKMHFPQLPDPQGWDVDFSDQDLADDWKCTERGTVSDIHFWFSSPQDQYFQLETVYVKIYDDDRITNPNFSQPGNLRWERIFFGGLGEVTVRLYGDGDQGWYDPSPLNPKVIPNDHFRIWQANIIKIPDPFIQEPNNIYWLDLQVRAMGQQGSPIELGWKTSLDHFEDDAVYHLPESPFYNELHDPATGESLDMAFVITGEPVELELDFGDAPDRPYPTYLGNNGARHVVVPGFCLGAPVRVSQESAPGVGDFDNNVLGYVDPYVTSLTTADYYQYGTPYGASFNGPEPPLTSDRSHLFLVRASDGLSLFVVHDIPEDASGGSSRMHWEIFGDTIALLQGDDPTEGMTISGGGTVIDSRHGWGTCCTDGFAVGSLDGFWTAIGDFNIPPASTSMNEWHVYSSDNSSIPLAFEMNRRVRLDYHTSLDPEPDGQPNPTATGDDIMDGNDDEDGVVFTSPLIPGHAATVDVIASADGLLDTWIDWEGDGSWAGNQVFNSVPLAAGRNSLTLMVPPTAIPHSKRFARFRFSSTGGLSYTGLAQDGEVEDHLVKIEPKPPVDHLKWSQPPIRSNPSAPPDTTTYKLYATTFQAVDQLLSVNPNTGAGSVIGNMSTLTPFGLSDRGTDLYTFDAFDNNSVVKIDPATGSTLQKLVINPPGITGEGALAFRSDGTGYLTSALGNAGQLWSFDVTVPSSTYIGSVTPSMDGMDFNANGVLYAIDQGSFTAALPYDLYTIDLATGATTLVGSTGVIATGHGVAGLTFAPDGTLYAAMNDELFTLNPLTAAATWIGPIGFAGVSGLTAMAVTETEPELPVFCGWDEPSYAPLPTGTPRMKFVADDYRCIGSMPVTSIHWWGSYLGWDNPELPMPQPESWLITFWSNMPRGFANFSYPETPLWRVRVPSDRVKVEYIGEDRFPLNPDIPSEACFQYYLDLQPDELFWQQDYLDRTKENIFWISIVALYNSATQIGNPWGWKARPWSWMDDAVTFNLDAEIPIGDKLTPDIVRPLEYQGESYDVAFELDTDPCYIKWEQPFTGLIHWPHYEDVLSMGEVVPPQTLSKYLQKPDLPQGIDVDATDDGTTVSAQILADDFPCTTTGLITDVHIWASWFNDEPPNGDPGQVIITLSIHDDIPAVPGDPDSFSQPGHLRKSWTFQPGEFNVEEVQAYPQGYYSPCIDRWYPNNHYRAFRYDFDIPLAEAFKQEGSTDKPIIYWLDVQARPLSPTQGARFGWKTTFFDPGIDKKDVAVFGVGREPFNGPWKPMYHPETKERLDMAFEITTTTEPELQIQRLVADDWKCEKETPVTAAVWWGSYIGYRYQACQDFSIVRPQKPDYFLLNIWSDVPAGADPLSPYSHPGDIIWEHRAYNYNEVLVGFDKHPHGGASADSGCPTCGAEKDTSAVAQIRTEAMAAAMEVLAGLQKTNMGTEEPVIFTGHDLSTGESAAASASCGNILYAPSNPDDPNFRAAVSLACGGATVDYYDARVGTPSVSMLSTYDCVMTWANYAYNDVNGFGNNLADYVDAGGKVILGQWCYPSTQPNPLGGRIITPGYCPVTVSSYSSGSYNGDGTDCVHNGVTAYDTSYLDQATLLAGNMSDGTFMLPTGGNTLAVAWRPDRRVYYSPGNTGSFFGTGDWAQLTCNMCCCAAAREPVFRYSVRLPQTNWFRQEDVNNIYWFSVVAVFEDPATVNHYPWGWTNHPHAFNDDAVAGVYDPPAGWFWTELFDQTGQSEDMSFMLFTEPGCFPASHPDYFQWLSVDKPACWCYPRQCHGDACNDAQGRQNYWASTNDLAVLIAAWNKPYPLIAGLTEPLSGELLICADFDHLPQGRMQYRVSANDLSILIANWNMPNKPDPNCFD